MRKVARPGGKFTKVELPLRSSSPQPPPIIYTTIQPRPHVLEAILDYLPRRDVYNLGSSTRRLHGLIASLAHGRQAYGTRDRNDPVPDPYFLQAVKKFAGGDCVETKLHSGSDTRPCLTTLYNSSARMQQCEGLPEFCAPKPYPGPYPIGSYHIHNPGLICEYDNMINQVGFRREITTAAINNRMGVCSECRGQELRRIHVLLRAKPRAKVAHHCHCEADANDKTVWNCYSCKEWTSKGLTQAGNAYRQRLRYVYRDESNFTGTQVYFDYNRAPHPTNEPRFRCGRLNPDYHNWASIFMCTVCKQLMMESRQLRLPTATFKAELVQALLSKNPVPTTIVYE